MLNNRRRHIIQYLAEMKGLISIQELAKLFEVSERTIRYDLENISYFLAQHGFDLEHHHGKGEYQLHAKPSEISRLLPLIKDVNNISYIHSAIERQLMVIHYLIIKSRTVTLQELANQLMTSKGTIIQDLEKVEMWLTPFKIKLIRTKKGYILEGSEKEKRQAILSVIRWFGHLWEDMDPLVQMDWSHLSHANLNTMKRIVRTNMKQHFHVDDYSFAQVYHLLSLQIQRNRQEYTLSAWEIGKDQKEISSLDLFVRQLFQEVEEEMNISFSETEKEYCKQHILAFCLDIIPDYSHYFCQQSLNVFLKKVFLRLGISQVPVDTFEIARKEWEKLSWQAHYDLLLSTPLAEKLKENYGFLIYHVLESLSDMKDEVYTQVSLDQLFPIIMYIASIFENQLSQTKNVKAAIICPNGYISSHLLAARIKNKFPQIGIYGPYSISDFEEHKEELNIDFICSTVSLKTHDIPVLVVSPFLEEQEVDKIQHLLHKLEQEKLVRLNGQKMNSIHSIIPDHQIRFITEKKSLKEVIWEGVNILVQYHYVTPAYFDDICAVLDERGAYFEIAPRLLLPHAVSNHVQRVGLSLIRLREPIIISSTQMIHAVLTLATPDDSAHLPLIKQLHDFLLEPTNMKQLIYGAEDE